MEEKMKRVDTPGVAWLYCNLTYPLLSSNKIRQALSLALDRNTICQKTLNFAPLETHIPAELF
jgi:ABC-type oligopeptide transport system substrate-binding subunit